MKSENVFDSTAHLFKCKKRINSDRIKEISLWDLFRWLNEGNQRKKLVKSSKFISINKKLRTDIGVENQAEIHKWP